MCRLLQLPPRHHLPPVPASFPSLCLCPPPLVGGGLASSPRLPLTHSRGFPFLPHSFCCRRCRRVEQALTHKALREAGVEVWTT
eukprot:364040-Chlamydomonas_euryale.AAC.11